ncbi:MAG: SbcC/MukB-like Walker B domain-containing protein [Syntrophomonas sp.]
MILLEKLLLFNWHLIFHQVINFKQINFITGDNGAGKSTIIDAMQVVLLGQTKEGVGFFNKAANVKSHRTLESYLRGKITENDDRSEYIHTRDVSNYIIMQYHDDKKNATFCLGVVFNTYAAGDFDHAFFYLKSELPEHHFIINNKPLNISGFKAFMNNKFKGKHTIFKTDTEYREMVISLLGVIPSKFFSLMKKAVPFSPIMDMEKFITEHVCTVSNEIDTYEMQQSFRTYQELGQQLQIVRAQIEALQNIEAAFQNLCSIRELLHMQEFMRHRINLQIHFEKLARIKTAIDKNQSQQKEVAQMISTRKTELSISQSELNELNRQLGAMDILRQTDEIARQLAAVQKQIEDRQQELARLNSLMLDMYSQWQAIIVKTESIIPGDYQATLENLELLSLDSGLITEEILIQLRNELRQLEEEIQSLRYDWQAEERNLKNQQNTLETEINNLQQGIKNYDRNLLLLQKLISDELSERYQQQIIPHILADLIEINDERWRDAVEGFLGNQKFHLIIIPEYFIDALKIYDRNKFKYKFANWGLIDIKRMAEEHVKIEKGNLAEIVTTSDPYAELFIKHRLGRVMRCEDVADLRKHHTAITPTCMLYQAYVARQLSENRYKDPYIGRSSIERQIIQKQEHMQKTREQLQIINRKIEQLSGVPEVYNHDNINSWVNIIDRSKELPELTDQAAKLKESLDSLQASSEMTYALVLTNKIELLNSTIKNIQEGMELLLKKEGELNTQNENLLDSIPNCEEDIENAQVVISANYGEDWADTELEAQFTVKMKSIRGLKAGLASISKEIEDTQPKAKKQQDFLINLRSSYNKEYRAPFNPVNDLNYEYSQELKRLMETMVLDYETKVNQAREQAERQFQEDFISKLRENIEQAQEQINDINKAIKDMAFGRDRYKFTINSNPNYRSFYKMITDDMLVSGYTLFSEPFQNKYKMEIEEIFTLIASQDTATSEANIKRFSDYRTYLTFDLKNIDDENRVSSLGKTIDEKSGGETQTPFYITVLASFMQLYRVRDKRNNNTARLVIFDEAYSKMDGERIKEALKLVKESELQVILSAPTEKLHLITPLVDCNIVVMRKEGQTVAINFEQKDLEVIYELQKGNS